MSLQPAQTFAADPGREPTVSRALVAFVCAGGTRELRPDTVQATQRAIANWLGCALGAVDDASVRAALAVADAIGGPAQASLVGRSRRLDVVNAALINGLAANALDYDDMHVPTLIHPTGAVAAAALALAEHTRASGLQLVRAVATGIEIECRLGLAMFPQHYDRGWHITATLGTFGAAAAGCVLLGLDARRTAHAFGLAATQASGLRAMLPNACKSFNIGKAASGGTLSALLAQAGFESEPEAIEAQFGLFDVFGWPEDPAAVLADLGCRDLVTEVSLKPYPCGVVIHPVIDACLALADASTFDASNVRRITLTVHPRTLVLAGRQHPDSALTGRFSVFHAAALALTRRAAGLATFDGTDVDDPQIRGLRERMVGVADPALQPRQARVRIERLDGTHAEHGIDHPSGSPQRPLSDAQLQRKFTELALRALDPTAAARVFAHCMQLARLPDLDKLIGEWSGAPADATAATARACEPR